MDPRIDGRHVTRLEAAARGLAAAVAVLGCLVLVGWVSGLATMNASTAMAFVLSAVPLARRRDRGSRRHAIARGGAAALVALIGLLTVPGATALGLLILGLAELALDRPRAVAVGQWLGVGVAFLGVLNLVGHVYRLLGLGHLYSPALAYAEMALHTAAGFVLAGAAVLCARPDRGMMAIVTSRTAGGVVARRLLPAALGLPFVLGWLRLLGERAGLWTFPTGFGFQVLATLALFVLIAWRSARVLHRTDIQRQQVDEALRRAHDDLETQVQQRTGDLRETVHALQLEADERRRVEQALRESERRYRQLVDSSRGLICTHDLDGTLLSVNPAAAQLLGYTSAELVGRNLGELLDPAVRDQFPRYLEQLREAPADEGVMRVVTRAGESRLWAYSNVRCEEPGRPPYVLGHAQDITALKRAEHLARQAEALRSVAQLANAAAHEINNPLTVVAGHLDMLLGRRSGDPDAVSRIDKALVAVDRIRTIIESMGRITRLERLDRVPHLPPQLDLRRSAAPPEPPSPSPPPT